MKKHFILFVISFMFICLNGSIFAERAANSQKLKDGSKLVSIKKNGSVVWYHVKKDGSRLIAHGSYKYPDGKPVNFKHGKKSKKSSKPSKKKLTIGSADDTYEQEVDSIAGQKKLKKKKSSDGKPFNFKKGKKVKKKSKPSKKEKDGTKKKKKSKKIKKK